MRIAFYGIYQLGAQALKALVAEGIDVALVVTKPEAGEVEPQPVRVLAEELGIPWMAPERLADPALEVALRAAAPGLALVAGFHKRIPPVLLEIPAKGTFNLHGSLLPRYRGPTLWKHTLMFGERETGVTVHVMTPDLDRGDILCRRAIPIGDEDTGGSLFLRTCAVAAEMAVEACRLLERGEPRMEPQEESEASVHYLLTDAECRVDWSWPAERIRNQVRGLDPRPGAWTLAGGRRLVIRQVARCPSPASGRPGQVLGADGAGWRVATGAGALWVRDLRLEGGSENLARLDPSELLGPGAAFGS